MNLLPFETANVCPTNSGTMVDRRDHVFMTFFWPVLFASSTFFCRWSSTKGPFFIERDICCFLFSPYFPLRRMIYLPECFRFFRVLRPLDNWPHGDRRWCHPPPPFDFASPPPCGWSTGFMAQPRTVGRHPI